ncbi:MAG: DUF2071 domain-containing protein [Pirellulaceae bacterium]|nr:DUF2071 domain-containing protein [Pirellulaceae bacterium]
MNQPIQPGRYSVLTARWVHLVMLNYEVDPKVLQPLVPPGTVLDSFQGKYFASMVGFQFRGARLFGIPVPFHQSFEEVNLRFYVRRELADGPRRGVVFFKEIVPKPAITWMARTLYNENYVTMPMSHLDEIGTSSRPTVSYGWEMDGRQQHVSVTVEGEPCLPDDNSEETFITEHYYGYCKQRNGTTLEYRVEHPRWSVWRAISSELDCDVAGTYGQDFAPFLNCPPTSAFLADGSAVQIRSGSRVNSTGDKSMPEA